MTPKNDQGRVAATTKSTPRSTRRLTKAEEVEIQASMDPLPGLLKPTEQWADEFRVSRGLVVEAYRRSNEAIVAFGRCLNEGKAAMEHGEWGRALNLAGVEEREAQQVMRIAKKPALSNPANFPVLPCAISSLNYLAGLQDDMVEELITSGVVHPDVTTEELKQKVRGQTAQQESRWSNPPENLTKTVTEFYGGTIDLTVDKNEQLSEEWNGKLFVNPPQVGEPYLTKGWVDKAKAEWRSGRALEVLLYLPVVTWTVWFATSSEREPQSASCSGNLASRMSWSCISVTATLSSRSAFDTEWGTVAVRAARPVG